MSSRELAGFVTTELRHLVAEAGTTTAYRTPLVGFAAADDPRLVELRQVANPCHLLPEDLLRGARSIISYFLPFAAGVVQANEEHREHVAEEWALAYVETNALIGKINTRLIKALAEQGVRAAAEPPTHNYDPDTLVSAWSHKSMGVIAGLGRFGLHQMVITDAGCAGRFGSLVVDARLPATPGVDSEYCLYYHDGSCVECVARCPVSALNEHVPVDRQRCNQRLERTRLQYAHLGRASACGKCAIGPCSFEPAVQH
jgi:epoxyqueuosine reductase QueG